MPEKGRRWRLKSALAAILFGRLATAIELNIQDQNSIQAAASNAVYGMMTYYHGNESGQIPGSFPEKWWEGSALFLTLLQYWHFTGDTTYNDELSVGLAWQGGQFGDYMPSNYSRYIGNDDQFFWSCAAMTAAELGFPDRTEPGSFSWLSLAQGVFNTQVKRWDNATCTGGMRWQIWLYEEGYSLKNSITNAGFFQIAARLYRYTNDEQYLQWAEKMWDWVVDVNLVNSKTWFVADTTPVSTNCSSVQNEPWTYNTGAFLMGAAYLYNHTTGAAQEKWLTVVNGLLGALLTQFFPDSTNGVIQEIACEPQGVCNDNEILFKGLTVSWLSFVSLLVPSTFDKITPKLETSASAAALSCSGLDNLTCGIKWYTKSWDESSGMEQQISAADIFVANLAKFEHKAPVTSTTGGKSKGNVMAGENDHQNPVELSPITTGSRAGAAILTAIVLGSWTCGIYWILMVE